MKTKKMHYFLLSRVNKNENIHPMTKVTGVLVSFVKFEQNSNNLERFFYNLNTN